MRTFMFLLLCLSISTTFAQNLKRKGSLGVGFYTTIPDSLAKALNLSGKKGTLVKFAVPNTTAENLKLQPNDFITKINDKNINDANDFLAVAKQLKADTPISMELLRGGKSLSVRGTVKPKPTEQNELADILYDEAAFDGGYLRTILKTPKGKKPLGTIYCIQGISCYSTDNLPVGDPIRDIMDGFLKNGFAVFVVEKANMGDSDSKTPCAKMGFHQETELFRTGYRKLLTYKNIDTSNIFLFGHSLGGVTAPVLAQEFQPKGVVVYGTVLQPWFDYLLDIHIIQEQLYGGDLAVLQDTVEMLKPTMYELFYNHKTAEELAKDTKHLWALQRGLGYQSNGECLAGRTAQFHVEINEVNLPKAWKNTHSYVLAVYGGADIAALNSKGHEDIANYVNQNHPDKGTYLFLPNTNHTLQEIGPMSEAVKMEGNPAYAKYASEHFNWKGINQMCDWMKDKVNKKL